MKECYYLNIIVELNEMNEREERKRLILRIEKRNDCFEREIECVVYEMRMNTWMVVVEEMD